MLRTTALQVAKKFEVIVGSPIEGRYPLFSRNIETGETAYIETFDTEAEAAALAATWLSR